MRRYNVGIVIIGRNEGERLARCFASTHGVHHRIYVDSGSTDGSVALANKAGIGVVHLKIPPQFTAARARNEGIRRILTQFPETQLVQVIDGDCEMIDGWLDAAVAELDRRTEVGAVFGRRREREPHASIYNALCDDEWNTPIGESAGFGGDALLRVTALQDVGYYNAIMIAGEDSELSYRLRERGWKIWRLATDMTWHDAAILSFGQWWNRTRRAGHGFAEMAFLHPEARWPNWSRSVKSIFVWGAAWPVGTTVMFALGMVMTPFLVLGFLSLSLALLRTGMLALRERRRGLVPRLAAASAVLLLIGKFPQFLGLGRFHLFRLIGKQSKLIEYKGPQVR